MCLRQAHREFLRPEIGAARHGLQGIDHLRRTVHIAVDVSDELRHDVLELQRAYGHPDTIGDLIIDA